MTNIIDIAFGFGCMLDDDTRLGESTARIDFEYYGNGNGNVHYNGSKGKEIIWMLEQGVATFCEVSKAVGKIISAPQAQRTIEKAIRFVSTLAGMN